MSETATHATKSVTEYLGSLVWDGTPRLDRWLIEYAGAEDSSHVRSASRAILIAAVRRARNPGCRFDQLPVIDGPQGSGKSAALRTLAVDPAWFSDEPLDLTNFRQILESTKGKWIVEATELESLFQRPRSVVDADDDAEDTEADGEDKDEDEDVAEDDDDDEGGGDEGGGDEGGGDEGGGDDLPPAAALKSFLSRQIDEARMPYQTERTRVPRPFVIVGTTAATPYLKDMTGNRRIWLIRVERFDLVRLAEVRDQLWAEAAVAEASGESIDLAPTVASA